jgi:hypothetical protein
VKTIQQKHASRAQVTALSKLQVLQLKHYQPDGDGAATAAGLTWPKHQWFTAVQAISL